MAARGAARLAALAIVIVGCSVAPASEPPAPLPSSTEATVPAASAPDVSASPPVEPSPSEGPSSPTPTGTPTASPSTPAPEPSGALRRAALVDQDGVRLRVVLDRNPLPAGEVSWATIEVVNTGSDTLHFLRDGCQIVASLVGEGLGEWPGMPAADAPFPRTFKGRVLSFAIPRKPYLKFVGSDRVGRENTGCADLGVYMTLDPGQRWQERVRWSGFSHYRLTPPPAGRYEIRARFDHYWRASEGETPDASLWRDRLVEVRFDAWVENDGPTLLSPEAVIDGALAYEPFARWISTQNLGNGRSEWFRYRLGDDVWEVGLVIWRDPEPRLQYVAVDPVDGSVRGGLIDRAWDKEADGFPG